MTQGVLNSVLSGCIIANQFAPKVHELRIFKTSDSIKKHYSRSQKLSQDIWVFKTYPFFPTNRSQSFLDDLEDPQNCTQCICQSFSASFHRGGAED